MWTHGYAFFKRDKRVVFQAAAHAQRAVAFLHGLQPNSQTERDAAALDASMNLSSAADPNRTFGARIAFQTGRHRISIVGSCEEGDTVV